MWRFLDLAQPVFARCDDSSGAVIQVFHSAVTDLGAIAQSAKPGPQELGDQVFGALRRNDYGQFDDLIQALQPALGPIGLEHLKQRMIALSAEPVRKPAANERQVIGWSSGGAIYADEIAESSRISTARLALQEIADAQGDVDSFIAQYEEPIRKVPKIAAEIARRLLAAGRVEEAWQTLEKTEHRQGGWPDFEWEDTRIDVLEALGRGDEAQAARWSCFERSLSARHLRDHLKQLPDFDDFEAEERALGYAERYSSLLQAVSFLVSWPSLDRAARTVVGRAKDLDGNHYEILTPTAESLTGKYPLAATLLLRAMIDSPSRKAGPAVMDMLPATSGIALVSLQRSRITAPSRRTMFTSAGCAESTVERQAFGTWSPGIVAPTTAAIADTGERTPREAGFGHCSRQVWMTHKGGFAGVPPPAAERPYCAQRCRSVDRAYFSKTDIASDDTDAAWLTSATFGCPAIV